MTCEYLWQCEYLFKIYATDNCMISWLHSDWQWHIFKVHCLMANNWISNTIILIVNTHICLAQVKTKSLFTCVVNMLWSWYLFTAVMIYTCIQIYKILVSLKSPQNPFQTCYHSRIFRLSLSENSLISDKRLEILMPVRMYLLPLYLLLMS